MKEFIVNTNDENQRIDRFLSKALTKSSGLGLNSIQKLIRKKKIKINGKRCEPSSKLIAGDIISVYVNISETVKGKTNKVINNPDIDVIYEDENILLVNKKAGMVVHEDNNNTADTLISRICCYLIRKGEYDPDSENSFTPALCNRIDRNTGGIVIAAKNAATLRIINEKLKNREIIKKYLCITVGHMPKKNDILTAYHFKNSKENIVYISNKKTKDNKTIITKYKVMQSNKNYDLVEVELITGRTHQIRAHFSHIGCPLLGDGKYGRNEINRAFKIKNQALYSYKVKFNFAEHTNLLGYLSGREFAINIRDIWFMDIFNNWCE